MRPRRPLAFAFLLLVVVGVAAVGGVGGVVDRGATYVTDPSYCTGMVGGGRDANHTLYLPCGQVGIALIKADGTTSVAQIRGLGASKTYVPSMVAPSPDGKHLYAINYNYFADDGGVNRFTKDAAGVYQRDTTFAWPVPNANWTAKGWKLCGFGISTDAYGGIYLSTAPTVEVGCNAPNAVLKYRDTGARAELVTSFGDGGKATTVGGSPGLFQPNESLAVTYDGSRVWIADNSNERVQYYDRDPNGVTYHHGGMWSGEGTLYEGKAPYTGGGVGSIYGVAVDPWDSVYVTQTTERRIWKLDANGRNPECVAGDSVPGKFTCAAPFHHVTVGNPDYSERPHRIAVDGQGGVWVGEWNKYVRRTKAVPGALPTLPAPVTPDAADPVLRTLTVPGETTAATVTATIAATDDKGVETMRFADESGNWGVWQPYATTATIRLTDGTGFKYVYAQVRDAVGRESNVMGAPVRRTAVVGGGGAAVDALDPTLAVVAPATSATRSVALIVTAQDDIGVTQLRTAGADGEFGAWQAWQSGVRTLNHEFPGSTGVQVVYVQVRDAAWRTSPVILVRVQVGEVKPADPEPPVQQGEEVDEDEVGPAPGTEGGTGTGGTTTGTTTGATTGTTTGATTGTTTGATTGTAGVPATTVGPDTRDRVAPRITKLVVPARNCSRRITIKIAAKDNARVANVRIANENGVYGRWLPYRASLVHTLSAKSGLKGVTIQVRDGSGNVSAASFRKSRVVACPKKHRR